VAGTKRPKQNHSNEVFERQAQLCKAFAHPSRLQILDLLGNGGFNVSTLHGVLGVSKTRISQHLTILKSAGVLATRRNGKQVICSLAIPEVKQACQLIRKVLEAHLAENRRLIE
jgi:DNA-binding transcriptional ArsR family regulator